MTSVRQAERTTRKRSTATAWAEAHAEQRAPTNIQLPPLRDRDTAADSGRVRINRTISASALPRTPSTRGLVSADNTLLMVWGIGGRFESTQALATVFGQFGEVKEAVVRHRLDDSGHNTSWALVTMGTASEVDDTLSAAEELAERFHLTVARFEAEKAAASSGAMINRQEMNAKWRTDAEGPLSVRREAQRTRKFGQSGASQAVLADTAGIEGSSMLRELHVGGYLYNVFFNASGSSIITAGDDRQVTMHATHTGDSRVLVERSISITVATMAPDGKLLAVGDDEGRLGVYALQDSETTERERMPTEETPRAKLRRELKPSARGLQLAWDPVDMHSTVVCAAFSQDSQLLATVCEDGTVEVRDALTGLGPRGISAGPVVLDFDGGASPEPGNCTLRFSADCLAVIGGSPSRYVQFWNVKTLEKVCTLGFPEQVLSVALRNDGVEAAVGFATGDVSVMKLTVPTYRVLRSLTVRQTSDVGSLAVGHLAAGDVVACVDSRPGPEGSGMTRLCIGDGWVSDYRKDGTKILEKISGNAHTPTSALRRTRGCSCRRIKQLGGSTEVPTVHLRMEWCDKLLRETDRKVMSMAYSETGHLLAIGKHCGTFLLFDTNSWACIATYVHGSSRGMALSFSPASDQLALGGGHFQCAVIHQLKPPALMQRLGLGSTQILGLTLSGLENNITSGCVSPDYAAICTGSHVRLINRHNVNDRVLIATKGPVSAREEPIALRNTEACQVAVVVSAKSVIVYDTKGQVIYELPGTEETSWDGECRGVAWSLDGQWLVAWGMFGAKVYDANTGTYRYHFTDNKSIVRDCEIDPTGRYILMAGTSRHVTIYEVSSETQIHKFIESGITGPCTFDPTGDRVAYFDRGRGTKGGKVVIRSVRTGKLLRTYEGVKANAQLRFSPLVGEYLLCVDFQRHLTVLNTRDGLPDRVLWGGLLRSMALPPGNFCQWAVGWVPLPLSSLEQHRIVWIGDLPEYVVHDQSNLRTALSIFGTIGSVTVQQKVGVQKNWALVSFDTAAAARRAWSTGSIEIVGPNETVSCQVRQFSTEGHAHSDATRLANVCAAHFSNRLALYAGINSEMMIVDIEQFALSVTEDATFTADRLVALTDNAPDQIGVVSRRFPQAVNRRHDDTDTDALCSGDTVLHYCARYGNTEALFEWLHGEATYEPVANNKGHTALHVAILSHNSKMIRQFFQQLTPNLNEVSGKLLTGSLKLLAQELPELVLEALQHIEVAALHEQHQFRTYAHRHEVLGIGSLVASPPDYHKSDLDSSRSEDVKSASTSKQEHAASGHEIWSEFLPSNDKSAVEILMSSKVLRLTNFIGVPEDSPYHDIVERCEANVFESKLMRLATQFKWERNCKHQIRMQMMSYAACMILASCAMTASALHGPRVQYQVVEHVAGDLLTPRTIDVLQVAMVVVESISISNEWIQMTREGWRKYFTVWNVIDMTSSSLLVVGAAGHFTMTDIWYIDANGATESVRFGIWGEHVVRNAGSIGVFLKWLGFLDYLRSLESTTGPIMRMIHVIVKDMYSFVTILLILMVGMVLFTVINMPWSDAHRYRAQPGSAGYLWPLIGMFRLIIFEEVDDEAFSQSALATFVVIIFAFFVIVLMMNLLIAIMGDSYEKVKEREYVEGVRERALTVVDMELRYPTMHEFPKYMLICEGVELDVKLHNPWAGIGGRIMQETSRTMARLTMLDNDLQSGMRSVNSVVESNQEKLATAIEVLDSVEAKIGDLVPSNRAAGSAAGVVEDLERLAALHAKSQLDDAEYALAKAAVLKTN